MKLAVDARLMAEHPRGMGQYARALVEPLRHELLALLPRNQSTTEWESLSAGASFFPWWEQKVLPELAQRGGATHLLCPSNTAPLRRIRGVKTIVVIHDLIFLRPLSELPASRSLYQNMGRLYRRAIVPAAAERADVLATVSEYTRNELADRFGIDHSRIHVVPNSLDAAWYALEPLHDAERGRYILTVTGEAPSKNLSALLKAFALMQAEGVGKEMVLRVVGIKPAFHGSYLAEVVGLGLSKKVVFESYVSEPELRRMYREAWAFVLPSLYEGFGIPLLEAMASGTPVVCSNTTSLPEVVGDAAWMFDPRNCEDMAAALGEAVSSAAERPRRASAGLARAEMFRREVVSRDIEKFWNSVA